LDDKHFTPWLNASAFFNGVLAGQLACCSVQTEHGKDGARLDGRQSIKGENVFSTGLKKT